MMRKILMAGAAALLMTGPAFAQSSAPAQGQMPAQGANTPTSGAGAVSGSMAPVQKPAQAKMPAQGAATPRSETGATAGKMGTMSKPSQAEMPAQGARTPSSKTGQVGSGSMKATMAHRATAQGGMAMANGQKGGIPKSELKAVPYDASTDTYLQIAEKAVSAHHKMRADIALGRAETNLLTNSYVAGSVNGPISSPAIDVIRKAREAVQAGNYSDASSLIQKAMSEPHVKQGADGGSMNNGMQK